ncbi:MAG: glutamate racemase [Candidatus Pacebacteria bacterium]|nr:glutamate racemase [Candidatus Paceibacterota bacterium]
MKIGLFDSGLGGLTILKAVVKELPQYNYVYYGDTANLPYGDKPENEIYELTKEGMRYLFEAGAALVVIACNTASAETARRLQQEFLPTEYPDRKILGIIVPTIEVLMFPVSTKAVLIGTTRTIQSGKYQLELDHKGNGNTILTQIATPELVPLIELNELEAAATQAIRKIETEAGESEVVVLGCTHYTEIKGQLREHFGESRTIISQDEIIPEKLADYLMRHHEISSQLVHDGERSIHLTEHRKDYDRIMGYLLGGVYVAEE